MKATYPFIFALVFLASCAKMAPAGFWTSFRKELIEINESDQGPWGGHREIRWKADNATRFNTQTILDFARKNGWTLTDSLTLVSDALLCENGVNKDDYMFDILTRTVLPEWKPMDVKIYVFKTGWISVRPGNDETDTEKNGFVGISNDGKTLLVYHQWGE